MQSRWCPRCGKKLDDLWFCPKHGEVPMKVMLKKKPGLRWHFWRWLQKVVDKHYGVLGR